MGKDLIKRSLKNLYRNQINFLCILLLSISCAIIIFGFSYLDSISNLWNDWTRKSVDFRTYVVNYDFDSMTEQEAIEKLSSFDHILKVTPSSGYIVSALAVDYIDDNNDGQINIRGVTTDSINIISGDDFSKTTNELICATKFNPNSNIYNTDFEIDTSFDLTEKIGSTINLKIAGSSEIETFKLIGLYDSNYDYSAGNVCYATADTVQFLNQKYQPKVFDIDELNKDGFATYLPIYIIIDDVDNSNMLLKKLESNGFYASRVITINTEIGDNIVKVTLTLAWVTCILSLAILLFSNMARINNRKKEFAIMKSIGYTKKNINELLYTESFIMSIISVVIGIILSFIALIILKKYFIISSVEFSRMTLKLSVTGLLIGIIISVVIPIVSSFISTKKIEEINTISMLKE